MIQHTRMNKKQRAELDRYTKKLGITTEGEAFVLLEILAMDWGREILLRDIEMIKYNHPQCTNLVWVKCRTGNGAWNFSVPNLGGRGWITDDIGEQGAYIRADLYHKMD